MKFGICNEIFRGWSCETTFKFIAETGFHAVEIAPFTIAPLVTDVPTAERRRLRDLAQSAGLEISGIHWVLAQTNGFAVIHEDASVRERTSAYLVELVNFCADLGGGFMIFGSPSQRSIPDGMPAATAWDCAEKTFRSAVCQAQERGITICFEPLAPTETNFINTAEEAIKFVERFQSPRFKIILDVKAMCSESKSIPEIIRASAGQAAYFHANDRNLKGPGFGDVDYQPIAAALKKIAYDGYVSVEVFRFEEGPETIATRSLRYLKAVMGNG
jgi:sugar phosphate isomerase/epimerase